MWKPATPFHGKGLSRKNDRLCPRSPQPRSGPRAGAGIARAGDLILGVVKENGLDRLGQIERLGELWRTLVGAETAGKSRIVSLKVGVLMIEVANSGLGQELSVYLKRDLLKKLRAESGLKITDLRCRVGGWATP